MDALYRLALHDAPYVFWAYAIILLGLAAYVVMIVLRMTKIDKEAGLLKETAQSIGKGADAATAVKEEARNA
ncbi:MAG: hypothetical protein FWE46_03550 [Coriobacteriia bacterium]|nr:hypothetical protein [Coriobacteriia bacterium]MCL2537368.1 hypothetical protein [Coriobacteriia bacterium]